MKVHTSARAVSGALLLAAFLTAISLARNAYWSDDLLLWGDTVRKSPGRARPNYEYGKAWSRAGEADIAFEYLRRARMIDPSHFDLGLGMAMERGVDIAVSSPHARTGRAAPYRPPDPYAEIERLARAGKTADAIKAYEEVREKEPRNAEVHNRLGRLYFIAHRLQDAYKAFATAIQISPNLAAAHSNMGFLHMIMGNTVEAIEEYEEAIRLDPSDAEPRAKLGQAYLLNGWAEDAVRELEQVLRMAPRNSTARKYLPKAREALERKQHPQPDPSVSRPSVTPL